MALLVANKCATVEARGSAVVSFMQGSGAWVENTWRQNGAELKSSAPRPT